jgi:hypothetical protein
VGVIGCASACASACICPPWASRANPPKPVVAVALRSSSQACLGAHPGHSLRDLPLVGTRRGVAVAALGAGSGSALANNSLTNTRSSLSSLEMMSGEVPLGRSDSESVRRLLIKLVTFPIGPTEFYLRACLLAMSDDEILSDASSPLSTALDYSRTRGEFSRYRRQCSELC